MHQVKVASVASDDELSIGPLGIFVSADEERQGELFEHGVIKSLKFVIGKRAEDGAWFGDVLDEEFVSEFVGVTCTGKTVHRKLETLKEKEDRDGEEESVQRGANRRDLEAS